MGIVNRRNAVLGWTVWQFGKRFAKKKAKGVVPSTAGESRRRRRKPAIVSGIAALGGALWFWRRRKGRSAQ